ncbi:hypothetical protein ZIOFF_069729 [Zingiber officinale]|uniref:Uncharacterized protein n=1 Tax=Zingiber officinale TaxID=94328 RepID=A0A8J5CE15_ZINOF|nr:hypothetical protein ZIOFF_069729 [Zingiber officinale]
MSEVWERSIQEWYKNSRTPNLEYLNLTSSFEISNTQIAHNLAVIHDRTCLASRVHLKNFKQILERCESLEKEVRSLKTAVRNLTILYTENKSLTRQEVCSLVAAISRQPELMEKEPLTLVEGLNKKLERVETLLRHLEGWTIAENLKDIQADLKTLLEQTKGGISPTTIPEELISKLQNLSLGPKEGKGTLRVSFLTRGYAQWRNGEANLLITRSMVGRLSNTPNIGLAYDVQGIVDFLTSHGVRALSGRRYSIAALQGLN